LAFLLACALAGTGWYRLGAARLAGIGWLWWWIAFAILCALGLSAVFTFHRHKCDSCGNTAITNQAALHYSERMAEAHPFPRELYHTHDQLRGPWHTEALDLLGMIAIVPLVVLVSAVMPFAMLVAGAVSELRRDRTSR